MDFSYYEMVEYDKLCLLVNIIWLWLLCIYLRNYTLSFKKLLTYNGNRHIYYDIDYDDNGGIKKIYYRISGDYFWYLLPEHIFNYKENKEFDISLLRRQYSRVLDLVEVYEKSYDDAFPILDRLSSFFILFLMIIMYILIILML